MTIKNKAPPYSHTTVDPYKTQGQINSLLNQYGVQKFQWSLDLERNIIQLVFEIDYLQDGESKRKLIKVSPSLFFEKRRTYDKVSGRHVVEHAPNLAASMRMLRAWIKSRLETVTYGLFSVESEFLSQIVVNRSGATVGETIHPQLEGNEELSLEDKSNLTR
jgi:hypothetical protein